MWTAKPIILNENIHKIVIYEGDTQLTYADVTRLWRDKSEFRDFYFSLLQSSPFEAFFWENPPVTTRTVRQVYEFVLVNSPQLAGVNADPDPFWEKFKSGASIIAFENLSRDAELIVPCPIVPQNVYAHFAPFIRSVPENQKHDLFITLANSLNSRINKDPTWVSTSGLGVYWLHIRLDTRPKYYNYQPYRTYSK